MSLANEDVFDNLRHVERILQPQFSVDYLKLFTEDATGFIWWAAIATAALPFKIIGSEQGMIISIKILAVLLPILGSFYLILKILEELSKDKYLLFLSYIIVALCSFMPVNIREIFMIFPDPMYIFFIVLSFYFLYKASNQFNRYFYYSIVAFGFSVSIKMVGALYGIVYLLYFIYNYRKLDIPVVVKSISLGLATLLLLNIIFLHPEVWKSFIRNLKEGSEIGRHGFPKLLWFHEYPPSIPLFSSNYINIYAFTLILAGAVFSMGYAFKKGINRDICIYFLMAFAVVVIYFLFSVFYMWTPHHYGLPILYFLPFLIFGTFYLALFDLESKQLTGPKVGLKVILSVLFVIGVVFLEKDNVLLRPGGYFGYIIPVTSGYTEGNYLEARYDAMRKMKQFLAAYDGKLDYIGAPRVLAVPLINGKKVNYYHLDHLGTARLVVSDLLIFWKQDWVYVQNFLNDNPNCTDHAMYLKIRDGELIYGGPDSKEGVTFEKVFEDNEFEIYKKVGL